MERTLLGRGRSRPAQDQTSEYRAMVLYNKALFDRKKRIVDRFVNYASETIAANKEDRSSARQGTVDHVPKIKRIAPKASEVIFRSHPNALQEGMKLDEFQSRNQDGGLNLLARTAECGRPIQSFIASQSLLQNNETMRIACRRRLTIEPSKPVTSYRKANILTAEKNEKNWVQCFYVAIKEGPIKDISMMIERFPHLVNQELTVNETALHVACRRGDRRVVKMLIKAGGKLDSLDYLGRTPKEVAMKERHDDLVKLIDRYITD